MNAFRRGFCLALAESGYTPQDLEDHLEKKANPFQLEQQMSIGNIPKALFRYLVDLPVAGAIGIGGTLGLGTAAALHALTKKKTPRDPIGELKRMELARELQFQNKAIRNRLLSKGYDLVDTATD